MFIDDATVGKLAAGITVTGQAGRTRTLAGVGVAAWIQRTMGLRIREALGVEKADFKEKRNGERYLKLRSQASRDGRSRVPLKHRKEGQGRNVPVPDYVWDMVQALPDGPLCPGPTTRYMKYNTAWDRFRAITGALKIDGYTTHSLRHQFASEALDDGMNIVDLSAVLGHADSSVTLRTYVHAMPDAEQRTRALMNARWTAKPALEGRRVGQRPRPPGPYCQQPEAGGSKGTRTTTASRQGLRRHRDRRGRDGRCLAAIPLAARRAARARSGTQASGPPARRRRRAREPSPWPYSQPR